MTPPGTIAWMLYGAYGVTGRMILDAALRRGTVPSSAGGMRNGWQRWRRKPACAQWSLRRVKLHKPGNPPSQARISY